MSNEWTIRVEPISLGQPRPYADHEYIYRLTFSSSRRYPRGQSDPSRDDVLAYVRGLKLTDWTYDREAGETGDWWVQFLDYCKEVDRGKPLHEPRQPDEFDRKYGVSIDQWVQPEYVTWEIRTVRRFTD